ncbi:hypothetical protein [Prevotella sp.]|uniref:hypothetical protein n=1 Tax=Prevotella sp. TaxID=59823 RepID=UPI003AF4CAB1
MKKAIIFAAALALTFSSCGNKTQNTAANADSAAVVANEEGGAELSADDQTTIDNLTAELQKAIDAKDAKTAISVLANLQTIYKNLAEEGKLEEAKAYGSAIKKFVNDNAETLKTIASGNSTVESLVNGIINLPTSAAATAEDAKAAITSDVVKLASPAIAKGETVVETAKAAAEMVKNAPEAVKNAAMSAVNNAASTAENAAKTAVDDAAAKANAAAAEGKKKLEEKRNADRQKAAEKVNEANKKANEAVNKAADKALKGLGLHNQE